MVILSTKSECSHTDRNTGRDWEVQIGIMLLQREFTMHVEVRVFNLSS